jgi:hypothetical protein
VVCVRSGVWLLRFVGGVGVGAQGKGSGEEERLRF